MHLRTFSYLSMLFLPALRILAQPVTVTPWVAAFYAGEDPDQPPPGRTLAEHRQRFQFRAALAGADPARAQLDWRIVGKDGKTVLADAGRITPDGLYHPPAAGFAEQRIFIEAFACGDPDRSGKALVVIHPARAVPGLDRPGPQVGCPDGERARTPGIRNRPLSAQDGVNLAQADLVRIAAIHHASEIPWAQGMLKDQWVVVDGGTVSAIDAQGLVRVLGVNRQGRHFTAMACNGGTGIEPESWRCVLWDPKLKDFSEMDAQGRFSPLPDSPRLAKPRIVVDRQGDVYVAGRALPLRTPSLWRHNRQEGWSIVDLGTLRRGPGQAQEGAPDRDGKEVEAPLRSVLSLALQPEERVLYVLGKGDLHHGCIQVVDCKRNSVATLPLHCREGNDLFQASPSARWAMAYRDGALLVCRTLAPEPAGKDLNQGMPRFGVIDLKTGWCDQARVDGAAACPMCPGPGAGPRAEPPWKEWVDLDLCHASALAPDGRIGFACRWEIGQFRPDWPVPEPPPAPVEVEAATPETKADPGAKAWSFLGLLKALNGDTSQPGPR